MLSPYSYCAVGKRILYAVPEWRSLAPRLDQIVKNSKFEQVKQTARTFAGFLSCQGQTGFLKRVETRGYVRGLIAHFTGSRAQRTLHQAEILTARGFRHPSPLLVMEERRWGSVRTTYVVTEALRGPRVLSEATIGRRHTLAFRKQASQQVAAEIRRLHDSGIYTRDMQETNLLIEHREDAFLLYFVDLEDFRAVTRVSWRRRMVNLVHLDRSIGRFASRAHRLRFLYDYLGARPPREEARRLIQKYLATRARIERRWALRNAGFTIQ